MRKWFNLNHLKVRTSLILVLLFFMLALVGGAALGLLSLHQNNAALQQIVKQQNAINSLRAALDNYEESQVVLSRALLQHVQKINSEENVGPAAWFKEDAGEIQEIDGDTSYLLSQARALLVSSQKNFAIYEELGSQIPEFESSHKGLVRLYQALISNGAIPLIDSLQKGEVAEFNSILNSRTKRLAEDLYVEVEQQNLLQQEVVNEHAEYQEWQYTLVIRFVSVAMALATFISILGYLFLNRMVLSPLRRMDNHFAKIAQGNLTENISTASTNEIGVLFTGLSRMQKELQGMVLSVRQGVDQIRQNAGDIRSGAVDLSSRSEQQAAALQQTAASMEQLASAVRQNTENASQANQVAQKSSEVARQGGEAVLSVVQTMQGISASADKISDIVNVIDSIAFQTNILALNAAVEAARAGEQGRGFAVVAGEVRSLAQRSAQAAREIKALITHSLEQVQKGSKQVDQAGKVVGEVVHSVTGVTTLMSEISHASDEQSQGIEQVNQAVLEMDSVVQQNTQLVHHAASSAELLQQYAEQLSKVVAIFKLSDETVIEMPDGNVSHPDLYHALDEQTYITGR